MGKYKPQQHNFMGGRLGKAAYAAAVGSSLVRAAWRMRGTSQPPVKKPRVAAAEKGDTDFVSTQKDSTLRYVAKPRSRKGRTRAKIAKRFKRRVQNVIYNSKNVNYWASDDGGAIKTAAVNTQNVDGAGLGGMTQNQFDEVLQAFRVAYNKPNATEADVKDFRVQIKSMCLDIQITNTGAAPIIFDAYQWVLRKNYIAAERPDVAFTNTWADTAAVRVGTNSSVGGNAGDGTAYTRILTNPSVTPFQNHRWCEYHKVLSKRQFVIGVGQIITIQLKQNRPKMLSGRVLDIYRYGIPGWTKGYLFFYKGAPTKNGIEVEHAACEFSWRQQRTMTVAGDYRTLDEKEVAVL